MRPKVVRTAAAHQEVRHGWVNYRSRLLNTISIGTPRLPPSLARFGPRLPWERGRLVRRRSVPHPIGGCQVRAAERRCHYGAPSIRAKPIGRPQDRGSSRAAAVRTAIATLPNLLSGLTASLEGEVLPFRMLATIPGQRLDARHWNRDRPGRPGGLRNGTQECLRYVARTPALSRITRVSVDDLRFGEIPQARYHLTW